jgi:hypothetical protein
MIGGQAVVIKTKFGLDGDEMLFPNAPRSRKRRNTCVIGMSMTRR